MATNKKAFTLHLLEDTFKKIQFIFKNKQRSIANKIEVLIIDEIKKYE
ncbi:putative acetyltransferase [Bacillus cereus ATCC 4342]|nr:putative acetyltransferase [Bacillus cereus ATCC 4342]KFM87924.1 putative acetyltransferase [Bacillus cereus ATCC 4342]